jgi:hypothetical protein
MSTHDRIYFARRAAEEQELATAAANAGAAEAHRKLQRAYLERASVGERIARQEAKSG